MKLLKVLLLCLFISTIPVYGEIEEAVDPTSVSLRGIIEWVKNFDFVTYVGQTDNINAVNGRDGQWLIKESSAGISIYICWNGEWQPFIVSRLDNDIVETINLKDRSVTSVKIALSTIKGENVEPNTIEGSNLKDNSVITAKIADGNVTKPKLANSSVGNAQLENLSISSEKLRSGAVTSDKIAQELENKTIKLIDGSIAEPSLSFDNNSISGLSYNATDSQMIVSYNNTEKIRIDNDVTFINLSELKLNSNIDSAISFNDNNDLNKVMFKYHVASETFTIQSQPDIYSLGFTETGKLVFNAPTNVDLNTYDILYPNYDVVLTGDSVIENVLSNKSTSDIFILNGIASTSLPIGLPESGVIYYDSTNNRFYGKSNNIWEILNTRNTDFTLAGLSEKNFSSLTNTPTTLEGYGITDAASISHTHDFPELSEWKVTVVNVTDTVGTFTSQLISDERRFVKIKNRDVFKPVYLGFDSDVTVSTGLPIRDTLHIEVPKNVPLNFISAEEIDIVIMEAGADASLYAHDFPELSEWKISVASVTSTISALTSQLISNERRFVAIKNRDEFKPVYLGFDSAVTVSTGIPINDTLYVEVPKDVPLYSISTEEVGIVMLEGGR